MATVNYNANEEEDDVEAKRGQGLQGMEAPTAGTAPPSAGGQATGAGQMGTQPGKTDFTRSNFVSARKLIDKNAGAGQTDLTQPWRAKIAQDSEASQSALSNYQSGLQGQVDAAKGDASAAQDAGTNQASFGRVMSFLKKPGEIGSFSGPQEQDYSGLQSLGTAAGVRSALKGQSRGAGGAGRYGRGMAALDAATFSADPNARQKINETQQQYGQLKAKQDEVSKQSTAAADEAKKAIQEQQSRATQTIRDRASGIEGEGAQAAQSYDWNKAAERSRNDQIKNSKEIANIRDVIKKEKDPEVRRALEQKFDDMEGRGFSDYNKKGSQAAGSLFNANQVGEYSKLMDLLGSQDKSIRADDPRNIANPNQFQGQRLEQDFLGSVEGIRKGISEKKELDAQRARNKNAKDTKADLSVQRMKSATSKDRQKAEAEKTMKAAAEKERSKKNSGQSANRRQS